MEQETQWPEMETMITHEVGVTKLAINTVVGFSTPDTMKLKGTICKREVIVLVDCGEIDNFISQKLVDNLKIPFMATSNYEVIMGIGVAMQGKGICRRVVLYFLELTIKENFLPLELGNLDVVLGMQWLSTLGVTVILFFDRATP